MSGHSKWATTKRKKAGIDAKRSKVFTKVAKLITVAARDGKSGDPAMNPSLRIAVDNAKAVSMPKDNIERAIKRGLGSLEGGAQLEEVTYEAYGPGGIAILIECLTDNKNRALGEIKTVINKAGGSFASAGSVSYLFKKAGQIIIDETKNSAKGEELEMAIIDSGADDFSKDDDLILVTCAFAELNHVKKNLEDGGIVIDAAEIAQIPAACTEVSEEKRASVEKILENLDDLDDVSNVYTNADL